jgi:hypothetical protein
MSWIFADKLVTVDDIPENAHGFIYRIVHIPTGRFYIGKKSLTSSRTKKIGKRELVKIKEERKANGISGRLPSKRVVKSDSDWMDYFSSNDWIKGEVKAGKSEEFTREILQFCHSKKNLSYWETWWQFHYDVLNNENSLNDNIGGRYYRKDV